MLALFVLERKTIDLRGEVLRLAGVGEAETGVDEVARSCARERGEMRDGDEDDDRRIGNSKIGGFGGVEIWEVGMHQSG